MAILIASFSYTRRMGAAFRQAPTWPLRSCPSISIAWSLPYLPILGDRYRMLVSMTGRRRSRTPAWLRHDRLHFPKDVEQRMREQIPEHLLGRVEPLAHDRREVFVAGVTRHNLVEVETRQNRNHGLASPSCSAFVALTVKTLDMKPSSLLAHAAGGQAQHQGRLRSETASERRNSSGHRRTTHSVSCRVGTRYAQYLSFP